MGTSGVMTVGSERGEWRRQLLQQESTSSLKDRVKAFLGRKDVVFLLPTGFGKFNFPADCIFFI